MTSLAIVSNLNVRREMNVRMLVKQTRNNKAARLLAVINIDAIASVQLENVRPPHVRASDAWILM